MSPTHAGMNRVYCSNVPHTRGDEPENYQNIPHTHGDESYVILLYMIPSKCPDEFIVKNYDQLTRCCIFIIKKRIAAEEISGIISDFYIKIKNNNLLLRYDPQKSSFDTYLYQSIKNFIYDRYHAKKIHITVQISDDLLPPTISGEGSTIDLQTFIMGLTGMDKAIAKDLIEDKDKSTIAKDHSMTKSGVSFYRKKLRVQWAKYQST